MSYFLIPSFNFQLAIPRPPYPLFTGKGVKFYTPRISDNLCIIFLNLNSKIFQGGLWQWCKRMRQFCTRHLKFDLKSKHENFANILLIKVVLQETKGTCFSSPIFPQIPQTAIKSQQPKTGYPSTSQLTPRSYGSTSALQSQNLVEGYQLKPSSSFSNLPQYGIIPEGLNPFNSTICANFLFDRMGCWGSHYKAIKNSISS